jgi:hypothetical protein
LGRPRKYANRTEADRERQRRHRAKPKQHVEAAPKIINAAFLQRCFLNAAMGKKITVPSLKDCESWVPDVSAMVALLGEPNGETLKPDIESSGRRFLKDLRLRRFDIEASVWNSKNKIFYDDGTAELLENPDDQMTYARLSSYAKQLPAIELAEKIVASLLPSDREKTPKVFDWRFLASAVLHSCAWALWRQAGISREGRKSVRKGSLICLFVYHFLDLLGHRHSQEDISRVLEKGLW